MYWLLCATINGILRTLGLQAQEFAAEKASGYQATAHQRFVGTGYFDEVAQKIAAGTSSTTALHGSTEEDQFSKDQQ